MNINFFDEKKKKTQVFFLFLFLFFISFTSAVGIDNANIPHIEKKIEILTQANAMVAEFMITPPLRATLSALSKRNINCSNWTDIELLIWYLENEKEL